MRECKEGNEWCQAVQLCGRLLGGGQESTNKPHRTQPTEHETPDDPGGNLICGLMAYTLDRIEQTQTHSVFHWPQS